MERDSFRTMRRLVCLGGLIACCLIAGNQITLAAKADSKADDQVPTFRYDPNWPKELPHEWITGIVSSVFVSKDDHIWVLQRPNTTTAGVERDLLNNLGDCCTPAPPVLEFDQTGNLVQAWGPIHITDPATKTEVLAGDQVAGPYPDGLWVGSHGVSEHGIFVDYKNNVWIVNNGRPSWIAKFTHDGKFLKRFGTKEAITNADTANFAGPTAIYVDPQTNEAFVSDGYWNRRVIVFDADTGAFKRMWGANGKPPRDPQEKNGFGRDRIADQFSVAHCIVPDKNGLLYVCDRANSRIQVFKKDGTFVREIHVGKERDPTKPTHNGNAWAVAFSPDKDQRFMYVADGTNKKIWIFRHSDFKVVGSLGHGGRQGGQFQTIHTLDVDSHGNIYTGETLSGNRVQRFLFTGMRPASAE